MEGDKQECRVCGETKELDQFHRHRGYSNGRDRRCIICACEQKRRDRYGLEPKDYLKLLYSQNSECGICRTPHDELEHGLAVDHDHVTGQVRLLLCPNCNTGLGLFRDSPALLRRAAEYAELWGALDTSSVAVVDSEGRENDSDERKLDG